MEWPVPRLDQLPAGAGAQAVQDPLPHFRLVLGGSDEDGPKGRPFATGLDGVVVRPTARALVLPVPTELRRHGGPERTGIRFAVDPHVSLQDEGTWSGRHRGKPTAATPL